MEQLASLKGRQILDDPFMVNELIMWYKKKKNVLSLRRMIRLVGTI